MPAHGHRLWRTRGHSALTTHHSLFAIRRSRAAFTLIELMVAIGLMALMMSMIATIFYQATQSFMIALRTNSSATVASSRSMAPWNQAARSWTVCDG